MPVIKISGTGKALTASPAVSLLNTLIREGIKINHLCGGKAMCGTCRVRIVSGMENLSPAGVREKARLSAIKAKPDERLACQAYPRGDVEIIIPGSRQPGFPGQLSG